MERQAVVCCMGLLLTSISSCSVPAPGVHTSIHIVLALPMQRFVQRRLQQRPA
jgi:hypothetical protein